MAEKVQKAIDSQKKYKEREAQIKENLKKMENLEIWKTMFDWFRNEYGIHIAYRRWKQMFEVSNATLWQFKEVEKKIDQFVSWFKECHYIGA